MKKILIISLGVLIIAILFFAVFLQNGERQVTINILGEDTATLNAIEEIKDHFEIEKNIKVNIVKNTFEVLQQKAGQDLANGTGLYDIILNYNFSLSSYTENGWVLTIDEYKQYFDAETAERFEDDVFSNIWKETGYYRLSRDKEPRAIGYPFAGNTMLLVYNRSFFEDENNKKVFLGKYGEELTPPTTWKQYKNIAEFFTNPKNGTYGVVLEGASGGWLYYEICNFIYGMGGGILDKQFGWDGDMNTPVIINSPETIKALEFYFSLKPFNAGDYFSTGQNEQRELIKSKRAVMAIMWSDVLFDLVNSPDSDTFGYAPIPGDSSVIGGGIYYINKASKHPDIAAQFIEYLIQYDVQVALMEKGLCSALQSPYHDPKVKVIPYANALYKSLKKAKYMHEAGPDSNAIQEIITEIIQKIWRGKLSIKKGVLDANEEIIKKRKDIYGLINKVDNQ